MGGVCLTLYGFIAVSGLKMFKEIDLGENKNLFTVSAILIAGIGGLAIKIPYGIVNGSASVEVIEITEIATALILGICVYALMNYIEKKNATIAPEAGEEGEPESLLVAAVGPETSLEVGGEEAPAEETPADSTDAQ